MTLCDIINNEDNYQYVMTDCAVAIADQLKEVIGNCHLSTEHGKSCKIIAEFAGTSKVLEFGFEIIDQENKRVEATATVIDDYTGELIKHFSGPWKWFTEVTTESVLDWLDFS